MIFRNAWVLKSKEACHHNSDIMDTNQYTFRYLHIELHIKYEKRERK